MDLRIKFFVENKKYFAIETEEKEGLQLLDIARATLAMPQLKFKQISILPSIKKDVQTEIPEEIARESGHFFNKQYSPIEVPRNFLFKFISFIPVLKKNTLGEDLVLWENKIQVTEILAAWKHAGFPKKWGFEKKTS